MANVISGDLKVTGNLQAGTLTVPDASVTNSTVVANASIATSKLAQNALTTFPIPWTAWRLHDDMGALISDTAARATNEFGLVCGAFGAASPILKTQDDKTQNPATYYARCLMPVPDNYDNGETIRLRVHAGMLTTIADVSATVDAEVYVCDREGGIGADVCTTGLQDVNSLVLADKYFTLDGSSIAPSDVLDVRVTLVVKDNATGTAVYGMIGQVDLQCDTRP